MEWTEENGLLLIPLGLGWLAVWLLMPSERKRPRILGGLAGLAAILIMQMMLLPPAGDLVRNALFFLFAAGSVISAALMITDRNPVYSALWFALVTLSVCGLFLLNSAPFLAAATIIVYAGAIIVTFLFVIMLAQQSGTMLSSHCNRRWLPWGPSFCWVPCYSPCRNGATSAGQTRVSMPCQVSSLPFLWNFSRIL